MNYLKYNQSKCLDLTAYYAIEAVTMEEKQTNDNVRRLINKIKNMAKDSGFEVSERIMLKNIKTGRVYK